MYREWSTVWLGQPIVVKVWFHTYFIKEELWIGNHLIDRNKIWTWRSEELASKRLAAPVSIADRVYQLEVLGFGIDSKNYCNISIDGEIIGGDVDVKIPRTDLGTWPEIRRRGFLHFLVVTIYPNILKLIIGIAGFSIFVFSIVSFYYFVNAIPINWEITVTWFLQNIAAIIFGVSAGYFVRWRTWEKLYAQTIAHQRKLDALPVRLEMGSIQKMSVPDVSFR
jgi:hypothetical protein